MSKLPLLSADDGVDDGVDIGETTNVALVDDLCV